MMVNVKKRQECYSESELLDLIKQNSIVQNIDFEFDLFIINNNNLSDLLSDIEFHNCYFKRSFEISNLTINERIGLKFYNCLFNGEFKVFKQKCKHLDFISCDFEYAVEIIYSEFNTLKFSDSEIKSFISISDIKSRFIGLYENLIKNANFWNVKTERFDIKNLLKNKIGRIDFGQNPEIRFLDINSNNNIGIIDLDNIGTARLYGDFDKIYLFAESFKLISIGNKTDEKIIISNINELKFSNRNFDGQLKIQNSKINLLDFNDISSSNGNIKFNNLEVMSTTLFDVLISDFYWNQVTFLNKLNIVRCDFSGLKPNNVNWLKNRILTPDFVFDKNQTNIVEMRYQRDTFRQIKSAYQTNKNKIEELAFYRNEMSLYWKEINLTKAETKENRFLIFLNHFISNFGQSYFKPLFLLLIFHLIFCTSIWIIEFQTNFYSDYTYSFIKGMAEYVSWLNPVFTKPEHWSDGSTILSFFMRVSNGFFIYHFIKATRKFS